MWKKIKIEGKDFLVKHKINGASHTIVVTDVVQLWYEEIQEAKLLLRCKEMNKLVEASDEVFLSHALSLVESESDDVSRSLSIKDSINTLNLQASMEGLKFRMNFFLIPATHLQFYEEVTRPLLTLVSELEKRHKLLADVIKSKDVEIQEYKLEGAQISRKAVETKQFDLDTFSEKCSEDLSSTKSHVTHTPSTAFSPLVQDLLDKISAAPLIQINSTSTAEVKQNKSKKTNIKLKSPTKHKKPKMYEDDDEDDNVGEDRNNYESIEKVVKEESKTKENQPSSRQVKRKPNLKVQKGLNSL